MEKIVIKISGSLLYPPDKKYYEKTREVIGKIINKGYRIGIVVGGGPLARSYINSLRELNIQESILDILGIESARLNALSLSSALQPYSIPKVPKDLTEAIEIFSNNLIPILGGLQPGHSTNAVSMVLAESLNANVVINMLNNIDGIYDKNPNDPRSKKLDKITYKEMEELIKNMNQIAGGYELLDHVAFELIKRSKIKVIFINGKDPENLLKVINGEKIGTELIPD
ncbi:uridylate kinase, putative [Caldisphaera lagunensis DSM 15908]|uniref:Uridylate kinase n=1 Tax=Caldisphaera lagunensis (strain DSM 15908 / JCM 11604 / ANMR 0165 / IC-154) TaxID=1056495 RepID=L0AAL3_CALLD|nr:UMP kinase [Caldisphaera lagunensis]AFZ70921.1 uridylate kinase, putative [Caldisphaera lagunensis DSM 15908]